MKQGQDVLILAERIRGLMPARDVTEKRMLGGITFLMNGNMLCCASRQGLMVRVDKGAEAAALSRPFAQPCLGTGRPMAGFIMVGPAGIAESTALTQWLEMARAYVGRLPPKAARIER